MADAGHNIAALSPEAIREQLGRILASEGFANSDRISRFLRFAVEAGLRGEADQIKEYLVGREVFDRDDNYDPRLDPIVRVEARRLRTKLDEYYAGPGREDAIRIAFRKGSYAPLIGPAGSSAVPSVAAAVPRWAPAAVLFLIAAVAAYSYFWRDRPGDRIAVIPAHLLGWNSSEPNPVEENLVEEVTMELARRPSMSVISWPSVLPYRSARRKLRELAADLRAQFVLVVSVKRSEDTIHVTLHLVETAADNKRWSAEYSRKLDDAEATRRELARAIGGELEAYRRGRDR